MADPPSVGQNGHPVVVTMRTEPRAADAMLPAALLLCAIGMLTIAASVPSTIDAMPAAMRSIWKVGLVLVVCVGLVGGSWRGEFAVGLALRLGSLILLGTAASMYAISLFAGSGTAAAPTGVSVIAVTVVSWWVAGRMASALIGLRRANRDALCRSKEDSRRGHVNV